MNIIISNSSGRPIYEQITFQLKQLILTGELKPHDMLPSMRLLAKELRISVTREEILEILDMLFEEV